MNAAEKPEKAQQVTLMALLLLVGMTMHVVYVAEGMEMAAMLPESVVGARGAAPAPRQQPASPAAAGAVVVVPTWLIVLPQP